MDYSRCNDAFFPKIMFKALFKTIIFFNKYRIQIIRYLRQKVALNTVANHKGEIFVGGKTSLTSRTYLGKNPNFNGMKITGFGDVCIGDNFHSGSNCQIITSNHNYDNGNSIPYDSTYLSKNVLSLPMHPYLEEKKIKYICENLKDVIES